LAAPAVFDIWLCLRTSLRPAHLRQLLQVAPKPKSKQEMRSLSLLPQAAARLPDPPSAVADPAPLGYQYRCANVARRSAKMRHKRSQYVPLTFPAGI
jgi:hypothetical protein